MIQFHHVYKTYSDNVHALRDIHLNIDKGEFIFLTGPSGAGKTTFFKLLAGFDKPTSGKVKVGSFDLSKISNEEVPYFRRKIGVVFQDFKLLKDYNIFDNVSLPLKILGQSESMIKKKVTSALEIVGLHNKSDSFPEFLSGGEKQRVAIARAIIHQPEVLIADEPTGNLDPELSADIMNLFKKINAQGTTLVIATHDYNLIQKNPTSRIHLKNGALAEC